MPVDRARRSRASLDEACSAGSPNIVVWWSGWWSSGRFVDCFRKGVTGFLRFEWQRTPGQSESRCVPLQAIEGGGGHTRPSDPGTLFQGLPAGGGPRALEPEIAADVTSWEHGRWSGVMNAPKPRSELDSNSLPTGQTGTANTAAQKPADRVAREMGVLLALAIALGVTDLILTAGMMATGGMFESNPIARTVASGGVAALVLYKLSLIACHAGLLWFCRGAVIARWTARASIAILGLVIVQWILYFQAIDGLDQQAFSATARNHPGWVTTAPTSRSDASRPARPRIALGDG